MSNKLTQEEVEKIFSDQGCTFNDVYTNFNKSYNFICSCENDATAYIVNFKRGTRCKECSSKKMKIGKSNHRLDYDEVKNYIESVNYKLLSEKYTSSKDYLELLCPNEHIYRVKFSAFKYSGHRCGECCTNNQKKEYENVKNTIESVPGYILKSTEYKNIKSKLVVMCPKGHEYTVSFYSFGTLGSRCAECYYKSMCGEGHPRYKNYEDKSHRLMYLHLEKNKIHKILHDDPNYENYKKLIKDKTGRNIYSVDHIFPKIAFIDNDLDKLYKPDVIKEICNLRENLRIILNKDNNSKNGKYDQKEFMKWFGEKINNIKDTI